MSSSQKSTRTKLSGAASRKRKLERDEHLERVKKSMCIEKYTIPCKKDDNQEERLPIITDVEMVSTLEIDGNPTGISESNQETVENSRVQITLDSHATTHDNAPHTLKACESTVNGDICQETVDLSDIGLWPEQFDLSTIDYLILTGPTRVLLSEYPQDKEGRHFSNDYYVRKLRNGKETSDRRWLVYSASQNSIYCFCCKLLDRKSNVKLTSTGYSDWKHVVEALRCHEDSTSHQTQYATWLESEIRMMTGRTIDKMELDMIRKESMRWRNVLKRLIYFTLYLAENNLAFRGSSDKLFTPHNGNFLGLAQMVGKFDPVMDQHLTLAMAGDISDHYCGKNIQNEIIHLIANKVNSVNVSKAKLAGFYGIIADCTPDIGRREQLSITARIVDISGVEVEIKEIFLGFYTITDSTDNVAGDGSILEFIYQNQSPETGDSSEFAPYSPGNYEGQTSRIAEKSLNSTSESVTDQRPIGEALKHHTDTPVGVQSKKKHYPCLYCLKKVGNLVSHLIAVHKDEKYVRALRKLPPTPKNQMKTGKGNTKSPKVKSQRKKLIHKILVKSRKKYNRMVNDPNNFDVARRSRSRKKSLHTVGEYVMCPSCNETFLEEYLSKHMNLTHGRSDRKRNVRVQERMALKNMDPSANELTNEIISGLKYRSIREDVCHDSAIMHWLKIESMRYELNQRNYIALRAKLNRIANWMEEMRVLDLENNTDFPSMLDCGQYENLKRQ
ncbi:hypothetical protein QAD02_017903 [Eretmocerus hayati]|uniref:Uncharacterized protein n=1 Tax=Eretmocerus hayati TaxID=131215 RepID=A0ACC2PGF6_9HYME|nr:hypothetical protein QAD02_017903 [Eretmocerus hayati]